MPAPRRLGSSEFLYQVVALFVAMIVVHTLYVLAVRPQAELVLAQERVAMQSDPGYVQERSAWVIIRDFEQEACFILMLWAMAIMALKGVNTVRERRFLQLDFVAVEPGTRILPEDAREYARHIEELPASQQSFLLPRSLLSALHRFTATRNIQDVSATATCASATPPPNAWTPSFPCCATWPGPYPRSGSSVRCVASARPSGQAHRAVEGDIAGVTQSLGVAFNSTFIALLISIVLMFLLHQLQLQQERLVLDTQTYLDHQLIQHLQVG